ncbi:MAG: response regulator transcription factor [Hyphomicrobiales bacterium]
MEQKIKVLLAEDDKNLGLILKTFLDAKGFKTTLCPDGEQAYKEFKSQEFDFCVLDVMMPVKDGFTLAKDIRKDDKAMPILFLTAKSMEQDKISGFDIGADDYITKPFSMEELLRRMQAILRRMQAEHLVRRQVYAIGNYTFDYNKMELNNEGDIKRLTNKEADLLKLLCENHNRVVSRSDALIHVWNEDNYFNARSMDVYITKIRKYLKDDPAVRLTNVHGVGFKLIIE